MFIKDQITKSILGWGKGLRPGNFELGIDSTVHNTSSVDGKPPFSSYKSAFLRKQRPTNLNLKGPISKYLDNLPS